MNPVTRHYSRQSHALVTGVFVYVAFVIDAYAGAIVGWEGSASKQTRFVKSAIRQAAALRSRQGHPIDGAIHHSDYAEFGLTPMPDPSIRA